jgi:hypothetical protein
MSTFTIDFFELSFLAEASIPPRPIARTMFWQNLTRTYWAQMTENERARLFEWINRNPFYEESLQKNEDTRVFHARFNPDNQYEVTTVFDGKTEKHRAFKMSETYYISLHTSVNEDYITDVAKLELKDID